MSPPDQYKNIDNEQGNPIVNLPDVSEMTQVTSDGAFNKDDLGEFDRKSVQYLAQRDEIYSLFLSIYKDYVNKVLKKNPTRQTVFFYVSLGILVLSPAQFIFCIFFLHNSESIVPILASGVEMSVALLIFPKIIAEYLFNTNETTSINDIVSAIQNYDIAVRSGIRQSVENDNPNNE